MTFCVEKLLLCVIEHNKNRVQDTMINMSMAFCAYLTNSMVVGPLQNLMFTSWSRNPSILWSV